MKCEDPTAVAVPLQLSPERNVVIVFENAVPAGFPSPAEDYQQKAIDLNELLIKHYSATYLINVSGHSMKDAYIPDKSTIIVDKAIRPESGMIVVAVVNGEMTIKRFVKDAAGVRLLPENKKYAPIEITDTMDFRIWGVVTKVIVDALKI